MRIALCLSGQPRGLEANIPLLLNGLVHPSSITDIFIHTWYDDSVIGMPFGSAQPHQSGRLGVWSPDTMELLRSLNPIKLMAEPPRQFDEFSHLENLESAVQTRLASGMYSVYMANELKSEYEREHEFTYDLVIRTRIDCNYVTSYNIVDFLSDNWTQDIHVPYVHQHMRENHYYPTLAGGSYLALSDTFAYGSSDTVNAFCSVYPNFEQIHHQIKPYQYGEAYYGYKTRHIHRIPVSMQHIDYTLSRH